MTVASLLLGAALSAQSPYGVCAHLSRDEFARRDEALKLMSVAGVRTVRADIDWFVKRTPDAPWDFSAYDKVIASAAREGIVLLPILNAPPKWAVPVSEHLTEFREYVEEAMRHLAGKCPVIEVWNEEDLPGASNLSNPTNYLEVLKIAYETVKAKDPAMKVAFGGVSGFGYGFLRTVYELGGAKYFDVFCCHPYTIPHAPEGRLDTGLEKLRELMSEFGDGGKPVWITELGFPTHRNGVGTVETQVMLSGFRIVRPDRKSWRVAYAPIVPDGRTPSQDFAAELLAVLPEGSTAVCCSPSELKALLATNGADAVVYPMDSEGYPSATVEAVTDFVRRGGVLVETGGAPMYFAYMTDASGGVVTDKSHNPERDRQKVRLGFSAWWLDKDIPKNTKAFATPRALQAGFKAHPAGYGGSRFITPKHLGEGDEFIPLVSGKSHSGKELAAAAVLKFNGDFKGAIIASGIQRGYGPVAHSEEQQAEYLVRSAALALAEGVERFFPYEFRATEHDPYDSESHFGIVHWNLAPKPAYGAYACLADRRPAGSVAANRPWHDKARQSYYPQWLRPDGKKAGMIWTLKAAGERELEFDSDDMSFMTVRGLPLPRRRIASGRYRVRVSDSPVYFTGGHLKRTESGRTRHATVPHRYPDQQLGYPRYIAEVARKRQPKVVFLGDSITRHWCDTGKEQWKRYLDNETYRPVNLGVSGDRTDEVLWRIDDGCLDGYEAKCVVLMIGTNNTGHFKVEDESPEDTASGIAAILKRIRAKQPKAKIVLCAIFPRGAKPDDPNRKRNEAVNRRIRAFADGKGVLWLDFNKQFLTPDGELTREMAPDLLHPGPQGYELWFKALKPYLDKAVSD